VFGPANMPPALAKRVAEELAKAAKAPAVIEKLSAQGMEVSGGDIRNAVLKAALAAAARSGPDSAKRIEQRDLIAGAESVLAGKQVMRQSVFADAAAGSTQGALADATAQHINRVLTYALGIAGLSFIVAVIALIIAALK